MRPVRPGEYESDLAALQRLRRRITHESRKGVSWKQKMFQLIDNLFGEVQDVATERTMATSEKTSEPKRALSKKTARRVRAERGIA